jgi:4-amino-4-deoxy-L-arabinose transferase-like glycosyltransferase
VRHHGAQEFAQDAPAQSLQNARSFAILHHMLNPISVPALLAGLALRLFYIFRYPFYAGDTKFYKELAANWLDHGVYGLWVQSTLMPVDQRMPGYPAFVAAVYAVFGRPDRSVMLVQAVVDLFTCLLVAALAAQLAPANRQMRAALIALLLAALCPFLANYTAVVLAEPLAIFLNTVAVLYFVRLFVRLDAIRTAEAMSRAETFAEVRGWLIGGFLVGLGTLVRPETPLLLAAAGMVLTIRWWKPANWKRLLLAATWMALGLILPLMPWAIRNARTLGRIEFLSPRYAQSAGDYMPQGFYAWTRTWMVRFDDSYQMEWKLGKAPMLASSVPASAYDSPAERLRITEMLAQYNHDLQLTPQIDGRFAQAARERTRSHPLRTWLEIPVERAWNIWFTPRIELLPFSGKLLPLDQRWRGNPADFSFTLAYGTLNFIYVGLAVAGATRFRRHPATFFLVGWILIRTAVLTQMQTVEPRYVMVCYPAILALGALALVGRGAPVESGIGG